VSAEWYVSGEPGAAALRLPLSGSRFTVFDV
jgi:hypothetical protein